MLKASESELDAGAGGSEKMDGRGGIIQEGRGTKRSSIRKDGRLGWCGVRGIIALCGAKNLGCCG